MNQTLKEATVWGHHYYSPSYAIIRFFPGGLNFAKRLKTLQGLTPYQHACECWRNSGYAVAGSTLFIRR